MNLNINTLKKLYYLYNILTITNKTNFMSQVIAQ
jgi:hypothetical protein